MFGYAAWDHLNLCDLHGNACAAPGARAVHQWWSQFLIDIPACIVDLGMPEARPRLLRRPVELLFAILRAGAPLHPQRHRRSRGLKVNRRRPRRSTLRGWRPMRWTRKLEAD
eukprot:8671812-Pyramimonas_sp.AAC.1